MGLLKRHTMVVEIETDTAMGSHQAEDKLLHWLETFGYTSSSHGFEFFMVGRIARKPMKHRTKKGKS